VILDDLPYETTLAKRREALTTLCVHAGEPKDPQTGALDVPIVMSSAFGFESADDAAAAFRGESDAYIYGRWENPTVRALEEKVAALESAEDACVTASGMAAIAGAVMSLVDAGGHVIAPRSMYAEAARLLRERLPRFGVTTTFVDSTTEAYAAAFRPETRVVYVETPQNPTLGLLDIGALSGLAHARGCTLVVDGTFATPFCQSPIELGADLVVHSMTKAMSGHGDVIAGVLAGRKDLVFRARDLVVKGMGGVLSPLAAWLVLRGLRTFPLRQEQACRTAYALARTLAKDPRIAKVHHPSLPDHDGHRIATRQMHAYGALLSFELAGDRAIERGARFLESVNVATHAVSLGDTRTLVVHPASTTHSTMPKDTRLLAGIGDGLVRVSVGLESEADLTEDLVRALDLAEKG
jgi:methionine-gamma-lyase